MADSGVAGQPIDHFAARKSVADQAKAPLGVETLTVERDDTRRFLAAVLQSMQPERGNGRGVGVAKNAEHAAFFAQPVCVKIEEGRFCHGFGPSAFQCAVPLASNNCCIPVRSARS